MYRYPTNIASVNLVISCNKAAITCNNIYASAGVSIVEKKPYCNSNIDPCANYHCIVAAETVPP